MAITPGTWEVWQSPSGKWAVRAVYEDDQGNRHTTWPAVCNATGEDNEANARLIAAAPKLQEENARLKARLAEALKALDDLLTAAQAHCDPGIDKYCVKIARCVREGGRVDD